MYKTGTEARAFLSQIQGKTAFLVKVFIAPSFTALPLLKDSPGIVLGAQNMHETDERAFTGVISARMLKDAGAQFVILGPCFSAL